jgi:hypothetical protein
VEQNGPSTQFGLLGALCDSVVRKTVSGLDPIRSGISHKPNLNDDYVVVISSRFPTGGYPFFTPYWKPAKDGFDARPRRHGFV